MGVRREGRELALTYLYQLDLGVERLEDIGAAIERDRSASERVRRFALDRVSGVWKHREAVDEMIVRHLRNWKMERLAKTDRALLRLAVFEMRFDPEVPEKVALNEALEIGRKFGGDESCRFLNGVLDAVLHDAP